MKHSTTLIRLSVVSLGAMCLALAIGTYAQAQGVWETKAPVPTYHAVPAIGVIAGQLYVVGGFPTTVVDVYDPGLNTWSTRTSMPTVRSFASAGGIDGKLYVVGGCINADCSGSATNLLEVYDSATNAWTPKASMSTVRASMASGVIAGKLYVAGGFQRCSGACPMVNTLEVYDPVTDTWDTTKASMPTTRAQMGSAVINGKLYVVGGTTNGTSAGSLATLEVYDPATDTWTTKAPMLTPRYAVGAGEVNGILYAVGGNIVGDITVYTVEAYNPTTDIWTTVAPTPTLHANSQPQGINGVLYVAADGSRTLTLEAFTPPAPPVCSAAYANPASLWAPNHKFIPITILGVTDPENDPVTITVIGVKQDEPVKSPGSGNMSPDAVIQGGSASVRSERDGNGNGRVYHLTFQADDGHGGTCTGDVTVGVPHSLGKGMIAIDDGQVYDSTLP